MRYVAKHRADGLGIERRAIRGDTPEFQVPIRQGSLQALQQGGDVIMSGIVIEPFIKNPLVRSIVDYRHYTVRPLIEFVGCHVARKRLQCPVQKGTQDW